MAKKKFSLMEEMQKSPMQELPNESSVVETPRVSVEEEIRATFIVKSSMARKLKLIATLEKRKQKDVIGDAIQEYVARWESEHEGVSLNAFDALA